MDARRGRDPAADATYVYDDSRAGQPYRPVAGFQRGTLLGTADRPSWAPTALTDLG